MKYKVGQKVRCVVKGCIGYGRQGVVTEVRENGRVIFREQEDRERECWDEPSHLRLVISPKEVSMPPIYILKKETHNLKKGAVLEPDGCYENGNYWYVPQDKADIKFPFKDRDLLVSKGQAEKQPEWFEKVELVPVPSNKMAQVKKILKGK